MNEDSLKIISFLFIKECFSLRILMKYVFNDINGWKYFQGFINGYIDDKKTIYSF